MYLSVVLLFEIAESFYPIIFLIMIFLFKNMLVFIYNCSIWTDKRFPFKEGKLSTLILNFRSGTIKPGVFWGFKKGFLQPEVESFVLICTIEDSENKHLKWNNASHTECSWPWNFSDCWSFQYTPLRI